MGEVIGFVLAGYIIVNADVAHCFVFTNKDAALFSTIPPAALMDSEPRRVESKEPGEKIIQGMEELREEG